MQYLSCYASKGSLADWGLLVHRHAGRSTINTDDVLLLARRNDGLGDLLKAFVDKEAVSGGAAKGKGKAKK